ncbi:MAG TPA: IS256 family transposase [Polyangiales bacterium]|nr:IS256 family transposase [Polyangiales bacterium]
MTRKTQKKLVQLMKEDKDILKEVVQTALQEILEAEMNEHIGAGPYERSGERRGYRAGYYSRSLITRVGKIELRVPQDREGNFSTELFERYQRSEKALVLAMMQMYVKGVSTRKVKAITEELCGHEFSASTISRLNKKLDEQLRSFAHRRLEEEFPYLILDARYERVREDNVVKRRAVLVAIGVGWDGRRHILGVELANRESRSSWKEFLNGLIDRGLRGVELVVSDHHDGLKQAIMEVLPEAYWQRCYVHFLRNAKDHMPRKGDDDCRTELRWLYERRDIEEARRDLAAWLAKWGDKYERLCVWVEDTIEETLSFYRLPRTHHKHMRSTNLLERFNQEIKRRTHIVRIFPNAESCWRLVTALAAEQHEEWQEGSRYIDMSLLRDLRKERMRQIEEEAA